MDSFEWNKIFGAVVGSLLLIYGGIKVLTEVVLHEEPLEELAYLRDALQEADAATATVEAEPAFDLGAALLSASADAGQRVAARCASCHNFEKGGANQIGPNLWGVMGKDIASKSDFGYSAALQGKEGAWDYEKMYEYLEDPRGWAPGTSMSFAGLRRSGDRVNILAYMAQQADAPLPFPAPAAPAEDVPADSDAGSEETPADASAETVEG